MSVVTQTVIPVFLLGLVGFIIGKIRKVDVKPFTDLIIFITGPALIISSLTKAKIEITNSFSVALGSLSVMLVMGTIAIIILKLTKSKKKGLILPIAVGNTGFLGFPVALFAFGNEGLARALIYDITNGLILFSIGIYIVARRNHLKEIFKLPLVYTLPFALTLNYFHIAIPPMIDKPLEMIGLMTIPLALMLLGYNVAHLKIKSFPLALGASVLRIGGGFLVAFAVVNLFSLTGLVKNIIILEAAMPSAVMSMILCQRYNQDADLAASIVLIGTMLSIVSIPLILSMIQ